MSQRLVAAVSSALAGRTSRRGFLARAAVVGAALATDPVGYVLRPGTAYASVCGPGATCGSGWTAFCATINKGTNTCPPGSFAAGWWKADYAGLCGGKARYYIDCNATCTRYPGVFTCVCHCSGDPCDGRRVCCNHFRYGQCHQEIGCYGPVVCRVVSCVPPWRWEKCSTSAATDNRTATQNSPYLPQYWDAIESHYTGLGGPGSFLGASVGGRRGLTGGTEQIYQRGRIFWSPSTGPRALAAYLLATYLRVGGPSSYLGYPTTEEQPTSARTGTYAHFQRGSIFWSSATGAHEVHGAIHARWLALAAERGPLGYPTTDTQRTAGAAGAYNDFQGGSIVWTPATGAWDLRTPVRDEWRNLQAEQGFLGYPVSGSTPTAAGDGLHNRFQGGVVYWSPATGAHPVSGPILNAWSAQSADSGQLGLPTSDPYAVSNGTRQDFQGGSITVDSATGQATVTYSTQPAG